MRLFQIVKYTLFAVLATVLQGCCGGGADSAPGPVSQAGSTAAMISYENALYTLDNSTLKIFDISDGFNPILKDELRLEFPETLFIHNDHLYVGGFTGVSIWNLQDPLNPEEVGFYEHARNCDPVILEGTTGYVTLGGSHTCNSQTSRLEIVDFSTPEAPTKIAEYPMTSPYGLAKTPDFLAVCEEQYGLTLLDVQDPFNIQRLANYPGIQCFDAIFSANNLILTASDGIYQFEASDQYLDELSVIPVRGQLQ
jgi:Uncharacterized conserved protein